MDFFGRGVGAEGGIEEDIGDALTGPLGGGLVKGFLLEEAEDEGGRSANGFLGFPLPFAIVLPVGADPLTK